MFKNYLKITLRNIKKQKGYSFINIAGLAVGLACCIIMLLWVQDELSWDRFHKNADEIYRVIAEQQTKDQIIHNARTPDPLAPVLKEQFPEIVNVIRYQSFSGWTVRYGEKAFLNDNLGTADPAFFEMFTFPFIKGDPKTALQDRHSIVITEDMAKKYFGNEEPMDKIISIGIDFKVTGVIKNLPHHSHLHFDCIFPIINMEDMWSENFEDWERIVFYTYVQLQKSGYVNNFSQKISNVVKNHYPESNINKIFLQPLRETHLYSTFQWDLDNYKQGNISYVYIFTLTALCILFIACINFMNLSTARSSIRAKEIGVRKVTGAFRMDIIKQFFGESILLSFISLFFAIFLTYLFLPVFNKLSDKQLILDFSSNIEFIIGLTAITILTGVISGSYPALFLSSFQPSRVLKDLSLTGKSSRSTLRKILVITQFSFTIILILSTTVIYNQLDYIRNRDLGFDKDHIIYAAEGPFRNKPEAVKSELLKNPSILHVTYSRPPNGKPWAESNFNWEGKNPSEMIVMYTNVVDYDYLKTFKMEMVEGRFFSRDFAVDTSNYVINEAAAKAMGIVSPVGKLFSHGEREGNIIGVIKDFHLSSLHSEIEPLVLEMSHEPHHISIKITATNLPETISYIERVWEKLSGGKDPLSYEFLDETIDNFYRTEKKIGLVFRYFTLLVIFISCLGLFGLSSFTAEQRTKEIGIRKVLGASVSGMVMLLSKEFTKWVLLANIIGWPVSYFIMNHWLRNFAYRTNIGWWTFLLAGMMTLFIALLTISYQSIKAATANPVESLRYE